MRAYTLILAGSCAALAAMPASAQRATRTVDDYLCEMLGKCDKSAKPVVDESIAAPETKGMSVGWRRSTKPSAGAGAGGSSQVQVPVTSARPTIAGPGAQRVRPPRRMASASTSRPSVRPARVGRVDLRLSFHLNSAELTAQAKEEAKVFAKALQTPDLAGKRLTIEGHTDASGSRQHNLSLSQRRAAAVADYLSTLGVARNRFEVRGYGPDRPLEGQKAVSPVNRRVEAQLLKGS